MADEEFVRFLQQTQFFIFVRESVPPYFQQLAKASDEEIEMSSVGVIESIPTTKSTEFRRLLKVVAGDHMQGRYLFIRSGLNDLAKDIRESMQIRNIGARQPALTREFIDMVVRATDTIENGRRPEFLHKVFDRNGELPLWHESELLAAIDVLLVDGNIGSSFNPYFSHLPTDSDKVQQYQKFFSRYNQLRLAGLFSDTNLGNRTIFEEIVSRFEDAVQKGSSSHLTQVLNYLVPTLVADNGPAADKLLVRLLNASIAGRTSHLSFIVNTIIVKSPADKAARWLAEFAVYPRSRQDFGSKLLSAVRERLKYTEAILRSDDKSAIDQKGYEALVFMVAAERMNFLNAIVLDGLSGEIEIRNLVNAFPYSIQQTPEGATLIRRYGSRWQTNYENGSAYAREQLAQCANLF